MSYYSIIKDFFKKPYNKMPEYVKEFFENEMFESFLAQKGFEKIHRMPLDETKKDALVSSISCAFDKHTEEVSLIYSFIKTFFPIADEFFYKIKQILISEFENSQSLFYYYLGQYVSENPMMIGSAKRILISAAKDTLANDLLIQNYSLSVELPLSSQKNNSIENCYLLAIKLGALREKYDAICFDQEKIVAIACNPKPVLYLQLKDQNFEYGLQYGAAYHNYLGNIKRNDSPGIIQQFYKCYICKYCRLTIIDESIRDIALSLLDRQFAAQYLTDKFFYFTGEIPSYLFSILSYLYSNLLILILCSSKTMQLISYKKIKKEMLWGDSISDLDYNLLIKQLGESPSFQSWIQSNDEGFIIARWQFDLDINIPEIVNKIALNSRVNSKIGSLSDSFGKKIYEDIVRGIASQYGWKVVPHSIRQKKDAHFVTDVDLIAYKSGVVLIGQIKVANSGRTPYEIWKAKQILDRAIEQSNTTIERFIEDQQLLFSILKRENYISQKSDIKTLLPMIITRSSYYIGMGCDVGIPIICLDMFQQVMSYLNLITDTDVIIHYLREPFDLFDIHVYNTITESYIENEEYSIIYEEILDENEN